MHCYVNIEVERQVKGLQCKFQYLDGKLLKPNRLLFPIPHCTAALKFPKTL